MSEREEQLNIPVEARAHLTSIDLLDSVKQSLTQSPTFQKAVALNYFEGISGRTIKFWHDGYYYEINYSSDSGFIGFSRQSGVTEEIVTIIASIDDHRTQNGFSYKKLEEGKQVEVIINSKEAADKILQTINI